MSAAAPANSVTAKGSAGNDDEVGTAAGLGTETMIGHDQRRARDHQCGNLLDHVLWDRNASQRLLRRPRRLRRYRLGGGLFNEFALAPAPGVSHVFHVLLTSRRLGG